MRAPRNPPFYRIRLFFFNDVFFNAKALTLLLSRRRRRNCAGTWNVTFYNVLRALADTVEKLPITLFDELSFGSISQSVYLLRQRWVSSPPLAHLADVFDSLCRWR